MVFSAFVFVSGTRYNPYSLLLPPGKLQNLTVLPANYIPLKKQSKLLKCKLYHIISPI